MTRCMRQGSGKQHEEFKATILGNSLQYPATDRDHLQTHHSSCCIVGMLLMWNVIILDIQDAIVEYFYLNFMSYQWHLYVSIMLLVANLGVQLCVALLEMFGAQVKDTAQREHPFPRHSWIHYLIFHGCSSTCQFGHQSSSCL